MDAESKALASLHSTSPTVRASGSVRQALADHLLPSEALDAVGKLVLAWPNGGRDASGGYLGALAAVLVEYPRMVATKCCDPVHGVSRETKFLPTVADIVAFCERETAELRRPVDYEDRFESQMQAAQARAAEDDAWQKARTERPTLEEMRAKHGPNWGIGASRDEQAEKAAAKSRHVEAMRRGNDRAHARMEGGTVSAGIPITSALLATPLMQKAAERYRDVDEGHDPL